MKLWLQAGTGNQPLVHNPKKEVSLEDTVMVAKKQIEEKQYEAVLVTKGIPPEHIKKYGFAFMGKTVLIG